jgi:serine/threonine-protein kinase
VVKVHDVGELDDIGPFMVLEYLEGKDLGQAIEDGRIPVVRAVDYVLQACDALAEAHALGIVHRDLKPENLFLTQRPNLPPIIKVIDFGISKTMPKYREKGWGRLTSANERFGTPVYMSPEQLRSSASVDAPTDIWALGVVLFELVTGVLPFQGVDVPQLCTSILMDAPARPSTIVPGLPRRFEKALLRCLEKDAAARFRNVGELAQELAPFGPSHASVTTSRIRAIVVQGGASIRPALPASGAPGSPPSPPPGERFRVVAPVDRPRPDAETLLAAPGEPPFVNAAQPDGTRRRGRVAAMFAAGAILTALGVVAVTSRGQAGIAPSPAAASAAPAPPPSSVLSSPAPASLQTVTADAPAQPTGSADAPAQPTAAKLAPAAASARRASSGPEGRGVARASSPPAADPSALDRRALYGARR